MKQMRLCVLYIVLGVVLAEKRSTTTSKSTLLTITLKTTPAPKKVSTTIRRPTTTESLDEFYENTTDFLSSCDVNSSACLPTELITTNNQTTLIDSYSISNFGGKILGSNDFSNGQFCTCNLQLNICDINCCCDKDCSTNDKLIFHHCEMEHLSYDTRYCNYMKYIYINNTPFEWQVNQNGLFCILKSNLPASYLLQKKQPIISYAKAMTEATTNKFSWPKVNIPTESSFNSSENFEQMSNIWILDKNGIGIFKLPNKFVSSRCLINEKVPNLVNVHRYCNIVDLKDENLNLRTYFDGKYVISAPKYVNLSKYKNGLLQDCPKNVCLSIVTQICDKNLQNCEPVITKNDTRINVTCKFDIKTRKNDCKNIVKKLQYNFFHNGARGFSKIELLAHLDNITYEFDGHIMEYKQEFHVNFLWVNQTRNFSAILSGNPGYLIGKAILAGKVKNIGNDTEPDFKIFRAPSNYLDNFLTLPENLKGICVLSQDSFIPIEFGYNLLSKCKLKGSLLYTKKKINGHEICRNIQRIILNAWDISKANKTVGMFGNADANHLEQWVQILYDRPVDFVLNHTTGTYFAKNDSVLCTNMITNLDIGIFHSRIDLQVLKNQQKILGVTYTLGDFIGYTFRHHNNVTSFEVDLTSSVVFYDVTAEKRRRFVDPPSLDIKFPYDFFYPFVKVNSAAGINISNDYSLVCGIFVMMHLNL